MPILFSHLNNIKTGFMTTLTAAKSADRKLNNSAMVRNKRVDTYSPALIKSFFLSINPSSGSPISPDSFPSQLVATGFPYSNNSTSRTLDAFVGWQLWTQIFSEKRQITGDKKSN